MLPLTQPTVCSSPAQTETPWFMVAVVMSLFALGGVVFGRFEAHTPPARRIAKQLVVVAVFMLVELLAGRPWSLGLLGLLGVFFVGVHGWWLPRNGVNGLTAEPYDVYLKLIGRSAPPSGLPVAQFRAARSVRSLDKVREFYGEGLGLPVIGEFRDHAGCSCVMFGLPNSRAHLEFTEGPHRPQERPHPDEAFVFYVPDGAVADALVRRLAARGYSAVAPVNPSWRQGGTTIADADGFHVVVMPSHGLGSSAPTARTSGR
jgi:catechol 2,3-dioxygenase-like lactoylglutathione lyase family enzyme